VNTDPASVVRVPEVYFVFLRKKRRYFVMRYIAGDTVESRKLRAGKYAKDDVLAVAAAVKQLINIRMPADTPLATSAADPSAMTFSSNACRLWNTPRSEISRPK
jgi:hypothetical protein